MSSKNSLLRRVHSWLYDDDTPLDSEIVRVLTDNTEAHEREITPEGFAKREAEMDELRHSLIEEEKEQYQRLHYWGATRGAKLVKIGYRIAAVVMLLTVVTFLVSTVIELPPFGEPGNPYNNEVSARYIEQGIAETGAINFVAGMILDYRAFDTFGESTVLFVAACSVLILMKLGDHGKDEKPTKAMLEAEWDDRHFEPKNDEILQLAAKVLVPILLMYGIYVVLNGHLSPGGGFSGGAIMGAALILYLNAFGFEKTSRFFTFRLFRWVTFLALMTYAGLKSYSFFTGANHIHSGIPLGTPGAILSSGLILPLNICVGFIVMCTMYAFYTLFRKGGMK